MTTASVLAWLVEASIVLALIVALVFVSRAVGRRRLAATWIYALWLAVPAALLVSLSPAGLFALPVDEPAPWLLAVWLLGALGFLVAHAAAQLRFERAVVATARRPDARERVALERAAAGTGLVAAESFRFSSMVGSPVACGVIRSLVLLPEGFLDRYSPDERRVMTLHEAEHVRAGHVAHRLIARVIRDLFWFHPLAWLAERAFIADQELACDQAALARDASIRPRTYAETLLKTARLIAGRPASAPAATVPLIAMQDLKLRTTMLGGHAAIGQTPVAGALVLGGLALASLLAGFALKSVADRPTLAGRTLSSAADDAVPSQPAERATLVVDLTPAAPAGAARPASAPLTPEEDAENEKTTVTIFVEPTSPRLLSPAAGELVVAAQNKLTEGDVEGARDELNRALALPLSPYELGVALYMRGGAKYQLGDADGALADWSRAIEEGDLAPTERLSLLYNIAQLRLAQGDYRAAAEALEDWIAAGGLPNDGVHLNMAAAYIQLGDLQRALEHARAASEMANPRTATHHDTLSYIYDLLGMNAEWRALVEAIPPDERTPEQEQMLRDLEPVP